MISAFICANIYGQLLVCSVNRCTGEKTITSYPWKIKMV